MEIPDISIISDFQAGMNCLQNPSLLSGSFSLSGIGKVSQVYSFWKWAALILAVVATFSGMLINRIKILLYRFRTFKPLASSEAFFEQLEDDYDFSEDDTCSLSSSEDEESESTPSSVDRQPADEDFCVAGSSYYQDEQWNNHDLRQRRRSVGDWLSWSDFGTGKSVVKLWDSLGFGLDLEDSSGSVISIWDLNKDRKISSIFGGRCQIPAVSMWSPTVFLSAGVNDSNSVVFAGNDTRVGRQIPAIYAEWRPSQRPIVGLISGGIDKVFVRDEVTGILMVGDMRNVKTPLVSLTGSD